MTDLVQTGVELRNERLRALISGLMDLVFIAGCITTVATQWAAWRLGYDRVLDEALLTLPAWLDRWAFLVSGLVLLVVGVMVWEIKRWDLKGLAWYLASLGWVSLALSYRGAAYDPRALWRWLQVLGGDSSWSWLASEVKTGSGLLLLVLGGLRIFFMMREGTDAERVGSHGTARFAKFKELLLVSLAEKPDPMGIFVGEVKGRRLFANGEQHVGIVSRSGGGKTLKCLVITLLHASAGMFVFDPKSELFRLTAAFRRSVLGHRIYRIDLGDESVVGPKNRLNPFDTIRKYPQDVGDMQRLGFSFVPRLREGSENQIWQDWARQVFVALGLHVLYCEREKTIGRMVALFGEHSFRDLLKMLRYSLHDRVGEYDWRVGQEVSQTHPYVRSVATQMLGMDSRQTGSIQGNLSAVLEPYQDPILVDSFSGTDIDLEAMLEGRATLYFTSDPVDIGRTRVLAHVLMDWLSSRHVERVQKSGGKPDGRKLLFILEEFYSLGRFPAMEQMLSIVRSYGIRVVYALQNRGQLRQVYGTSQVVSNTTSTFLTFGGPEDVETANMMKAHLGSRTIKVQSSSKSFRSGASVSDQERGRDLLTTDEIMNLPADEGLLFVTGARPTKFKALNVYVDDVFKELLESVPQSDEVDLDFQAPAWSEMGVVPSVSEARELYENDHPDEI